MVKALLGMILNVLQNGHGRFFAAFLRKMKNRKYLKNRKR